MKTLYLIGGTMGVGKTAVCRLLKKKLPNTVFLDGDWCWDAFPFTVNDETKAMVEQNICFLLNQFIHCSEYKNIIFCWVMHEQSIIDRITEKIDKTDCTVKSFSLVCDESTLKARLSKDITDGIRSPDIIERSVARIPLYSCLNTVKIDTNGKTAEAVADELLRL